MIRVAVLASGGGSNLQALIAWAKRQGEWAVELVISDRPTAGALIRAEQAGIASEIVEATGLTLRKVLDDRGISAILLAGYLRLVPADVVRAFRHRILNIHPALLPSFAGAGMYGARVHRAVLESGLEITGATIHEVDEVYDRGRILAQWPIRVSPDDTPEALAARVLAIEHRLYPRVADAVIQRLPGGAAHGSQFVFRCPDDAASLDPLDLPAIERQMDLALSTSVKPDN